MFCLIHNNFVVTTYHHQHAQRLLRHFIPNGKIPIPSSKNQSRVSIGHGFYFLQICDRSEEHHGLDMLAKECVFKCNQVINHNLSIMVLFLYCCLLYTSPSPRDGLLSRMPSSA